MYKSFFEVNRHRLYIYLVIKIAHAKLLRQANNLVLNKSLPVPCTSWREAWPSSGLLPYTLSPNFLKIFCSSFLVNFIVQCRCSRCCLFCNVNLKVYFSLKYLDFCRSFIGRFIIFTRLCITMQVVKLYY